MPQDNMAILAEGLGFGLGAVGAPVERLQEYLSKYGFLAPPERDPYARIRVGVHGARPTPGELDTVTVAGLRRFQQHFGLPVTGMMDAATVGLMTRPRCGFPDRPVQRGRPVSGGPAPFVVQGNKWDHTNITYHIDDYTNDVAKEQVDSAVIDAFALWAGAAPLTFTDAPNPDIHIKFAAGDHGDGFPFDGPSGVLAHAFYPPPNGGDLAGDAHFDDDETWMVDLPVPAGGFDLVTVAAHEFGHSLGLAHSTDPGALMYPYYGGPHRYLSTDDTLGIQTLYGAQIHPVPDWFGAEDQGADIAIGNISGGNRLDLVVFHVNNPGGENHGYYRIGKSLDTTGVTGGWSEVKAVPGWFGWEDQGAGIALGDINGSGQPDLVVFHVDNPGGENHGYYRIGWDLNADGDVTGGWSEVKAVPGWFGWEDQGAGIAVADINRDGRPDLLVFHVDNPSGDNHGYYRIGWNLDSAGDVIGGWGPVTEVPGWFGWENQGAGVAMADLNGTGRQDLVIFHVDNPGGENHGYYRVISDL